MFESWKIVGKFSFSDCKIYFVYKYFGNGVLLLNVHFLSNENFHFESF